MLVALGQVVDVVRAVDLAEVPIPVAARERLAVGAERLRLRPLRRSGPVAGAFAGPLGVVCFVTLLVSGWFMG